MLWAEVHLNKTVLEEKKRCRLRLSDLGIGLRSRACSEMDAVRKQGKF
jgi:hypothetical protein